MFSLPTPRPATKNKKNAFLVQQKLNAVSSAKKPYKKKPASHHTGNNSLVWVQQHSRNGVLVKGHFKKKAPAKQASIATGKAGLWLGLFTYEAKARMSEDEKATCILIWQLETRKQRAAARGVDEESLTY